MRLAEDDRGRIPFALIGVLLLVGSASYAATLAHRPGPAQRPDSVAAMNRVDGTVATAVHRGTKRAARSAAAEPLVVPANTTVGRLFQGNETFREYLRLRIYLAVREDLARSSVTVGGARAVPSLPDTPNATALGRAIERIHVTRMDGGIRVRVENVSVALRRGGRVVDRRNQTVVRTVATPVLALHELVERYEERLNRGPVEGPGLGRRLTARTNALAWTRGYAQYGGAPISNVVTNRHVELMANGAMLSTQRAVFGRSDPTGRRATAQAAVIVGGTDVLMAGLTKADTVRAVPSNPGQPQAPAPPKPAPPARPPTVADGNVTVGVNVTADRAFTSFVSGGDGTTLDDVVAEVYAADVRLVGATRPVTSNFDPPDRPQGANWTLVDNQTNRTVTVHSTNGPALSLPAKAGWHPLVNHTRRVTITDTIVHRWVNASGGERVTTTGTRVRTLRVTVGLAGRHAHSEYAPDRGIRVVHERGGPLDGPNLNGVVATASDRVEQQYGSPDVLARRFVVSGLSGSSLTVSGEEPTGLDEWLLADLSSLREVVRNLSVTVPRTRLGAGEVVPAEELAAKLRARRGALLDVPGTYGSVATKARIAARSAYLALVIDNLDARARQARGTRSRFDETLSELGVDPGVLSASLTVGASTDRPPAHPATAGGPLGVMNASVVTSPAYLTTSGVTHDRLSAVPPGDRYHPLVTRNTNLFTLPYGDAADWVVGSLFDSRRTSLRSAARTLRSANRALERRYDPDLTQRRDALRVSVARSLSYIRDEFVRALSSTRWLTRAEAVAAVDAGTGRWKTTTARAFAAVNGSLATAVARAARERTVNGSDVQEARLAGRLRVTLVRARGRALARPPQPDVNRSASATRSAAKQVVEAVISQGANATAGAVRRKLGDKLVLPPAGLPIAPVPGYWYVTTNVWTVTVRGEYLRFAVSVPAGPPGREVTYDRQRQVVALDWDDDGEAERLGRSTRLSFGVSTAAVVVVPPGGPGVGDRNGDADERSAGWPYPGNASSQVTTTSVPDE